MKWLKNLIGSKKSYPQTGGFDLLIIEDESPELSLTLGINEKRRLELHKLMLDSYKESVDVAHCAQAILKQTQHINEAAFVMMLLGRLHREKAETENPLFKLLFGEE